jgi:uncharacterized protein HemY
MAIFQIYTMLEMGITSVILSILIALIVSVFMRLFFIFKMGMGIDDFRGIKK